LDKNQPVVEAGENRSDLFGNLTATHGRSTQKMKIAGLDGRPQRCPRCGAFGTQPRASAVYRVRAVTLVEMLVVVAILGVILAIAIPAYEASRRSSLLRGCKANLVAIYQAAEAYKVRNRTYPQPWPA
jgi:prepilin-type N-terminal cleavage/methylation domain-containing protein